LERLATGEFSVDDWKKWAKCNLQQTSDERKRNFYENGTKLCAMKKNMNAFNISHLKKTGSPIAKIKAVNSLGAVKFPADKAQGLSNVLYLSKGARIVLTNNIWAEAKLVNGSRGTVRYIIYEDGKLPPHDQPAFIICHFPDYIGPSYLRTEDKLVPLVPMTRSWFEKNKQFSRIQYPIILGWAITIHKSQGMTLDEIILDVGEKEFATGLTYTGATRTRNFGLLAFDPFPNYHRFAKIFLSKGFKSRRKEELRKLKMAADQM
jgi:ATP-dependent DNA helicase PIF1